MDWTRKVNPVNTLMNKTKLQLSFLMLWCVAMVAGCARNDGKKTFAFLKAEHDILENAVIEAKKLSFPKPPAPPVFHKGDKISLRNRAEEIKAYHTALNAYLSTVIQNSQRSQQILNDAQTKVSGLDSTGVEEQAIDLTKAWESSFGDTVQVFVEIEALIRLEQAEIKAKAQSHIVETMIPGIIETVLTKNLKFAVKSFVKGVSSDMRQKIEQNQELQSHLARLEEATSACKRDTGNVVTKRSELITSYRVKYPKCPWNELFPPTSQNNRNVSTVTTDQ